MAVWVARDFDPRGTREPRRRTGLSPGFALLFRSTRHSRASTELRPSRTSNLKFRSTRHSRASTVDCGKTYVISVISIHEALASLDDPARNTVDTEALISIHEALASLDHSGIPPAATSDNFDPRGTREPRQRGRVQMPQREMISIHEALASLDWTCPSCLAAERDFDPRGTREPRHTSGGKGGCGTGFRSTRHSRASTEH